MAFRRMPSVALVALCSPALAQNFNIDIGLSQNGPASTYAAAGLPGVWNSITAPHTTPSTSPQAFDEMLVDIDGNPTNVGVHQFGGQDFYLDNDPSISGNDALLMNDVLVTHSVQLKSCFYFNGLENGTYEVITYAWHPNNPQVDQIVFIDFTPGVQTSGGTWTGQHQEGVTFTRHIVEVTNGFMGPHAGLPGGGDTVLGGACNGMQLRKLECSAQGFCSSGPNSTGAPALISTNDDCSVYMNQFELSAGPVPDQFGVFFYSAGSVNGGNGTPFGNGLLCIGGGSQIERLSVVLATGQTLSHTVDFTMPPTPAGQITNGSTWNFQAWFRDPAAGGANFDLSNAMSVMFGH